MNTCNFFVVFCGIRECNFLKINLNLNSKLMYAMNKDNGRAFHILLAAGSDLYVKDGEHRNLFQKSVSLGNIEFCRELLKLAEFDINERDLDGNTCLHYACQDENWEIMKFLKTKFNDLDTDSKNNLGQTPFDILKDFDSKTKAKAILF